MALKCLFHSLLITAQCLVTQLIAKDKLYEDYVTLVSRSL